MLIYLLHFHKYRNNLEEHFPVRDDCDYDTHNLVSFLFLGDFWIG